MANSMPILAFFCAPGLGPKGFSFKRTQMLSSKDTVGGQCATLKPTESVVRLHLQENQQPGFDSVERNGCRPTTGCVASPPPN